MSLADYEFKNTCYEILNKGLSTEGQSVRAHWPDGTPAYTIARFGIVNRFDLSREFPAVTLRKTPVKTATDEILWIWQQKSNNIHDLNAHIWDEWADSSGSIGSAYGYQMAQKHRCKDVTKEGLIKAFPNYEFAFVDYEGYDEHAQMISDPLINNHIMDFKEVFWDPETRRCAAVFAHGVWWMDQVDKVIYDLKVNPFSRRIMTTLWNLDDLDDMALQPCAWNTTFMVEQKPGHDKLTLNMSLHQRSQDVLAAWAFNTCQYAILQHMLAQVCDMEVGEFLHSDINCHIYDRHVEAVKELCSREPQPAPKFWLNPEVKDFYKFTPDDVRLDDYVVAGPQVEIEIAI